MQVIDPRELNDLAAFASRGGLGHGVALTDCVAEKPDQLMYLSGDALILLRDLGDILLASCEGVVGWVEKDHVKFDRIASSSVDATSRSASTSPTAGQGEGVPQTTVQSPSPPAQPASLPTSSPAKGAKRLAVSADIREERHVSNPFDLDSPARTPSLEAAQQGFTLPLQQSPQAKPAMAELDAQLGQLQRGKQAAIRHEDEDQKRESVDSVNSSSYGGIGGFMMGEPSEEEHTPGLTSVADSPLPSATHSAPTPQSVIIATPSKPAKYAADELSPTSAKSHTSVQSAGTWDIYDTYSRDSVYAERASKRFSPKVNPASAMQAGTRRKETPSLQSVISSTADRASVLSSNSWDDEGKAFEAARLALQKVGLQRKWADEEDEEVLSPRAEVQSLASPPALVRRTSAGSSEGHGGEVVASPPPRPARRRPLGIDLANGVPTLKESSPAKPKQEPDPQTPKAPSRATSPIDAAVATNSGSRLADAITNSRFRGEHDVRNGSVVELPMTPPVVRKVSEGTPRRLKIANPDSEDEGESAEQSSDGNHTADTSAELITPVPPVEAVVPEVSVAEEEDTARLKAEELIVRPPRPHAGERPYSKVEPLIALTDPAERRGTISASAPQPGPPKRSTSASHIHTGMAPPSTPWKPGSPASPHSIDATRQAVEAVRKTPETKRSRGMTLVGRMEADLGQASGPVPITFLIGDHASIPIPPVPTSGTALGLGIPRPAQARRGSGDRKASLPQSHTMPLAPPFMDDPVLRSPYPSIRSATTPLPSTLTDNTTEPPSNGMPKPGFFPRPRSRSFSAAVSKVIAKKAAPNLTIKTDIPTLPAMPSPTPGPASAGGSFKRPLFARQASMPASGLAPASSNLPSTPKSPAMSLSPDMLGISNHHANESAASLVPPSARSSSFSFRKSRGSKTPVMAASGVNGTSSAGPSPTRPLPSPVSNKDYEETVKADGLDFEIIQPKSKTSLLSPSPSSLSNSLDANGDGADLTRKGTVISSTSGRSLRTLPDTDEWGFIKEKSPTPEIFMGRAGGAEQRNLEMKWLSIINTPLAAGSQPPKKIRKLAIEGGIPASLRGRVWAWFMGPMMSARRAGLYQELLDHGREDKRLADRIDADVEGAYPDHSIYSETSTGQSDLRSILRAYSHFATGGYRSEMSLIAGMLLIHCVAEDAFWLLSGFVNGVLKDYYAQPGSGGKAAGMRVDAAVFAGVLHGSEPKLGKLFKDIGLHPIAFLEEWYAKLFIRCLPWPTALRIIDAVVAEGPRFLLIASLTVLTLSRDRLLELPRTYTDVLAYLKDIPHDALMLPEGFMKACENVKFKDDDLRRLRTGVEKELGLA